MPFIVKFRAGLAVAAVFLAAACATGGVSGADSAAARPRLAAIAKLPTCADAETATGALTGQIPDCQMKTRRSGLHLVITTDPVEDDLQSPSGFLSVSVTAGSGRPVGDFHEITHGRYAYPRLVHAIGDRRQDLAIPIATEVENSTYALWLQQENGDFAHAGQVTGSEISWATGGMVAAARRVRGDTGWNVTYYRLNAKGRLKEAALVTADGARPPRLRGQCSIVRIEDGANPAHFCKTR